MFLHPAKLGCRRIANKLLDMAIYDLICIMHEIVSGELRTRDLR